MDMPLIYSRDALLCGVPLKGTIQPAVTLDNHARTIGKSSHLVV